MGGLSPRLKNSPLNSFDLAMRGGNQAIIRILERWRLANRVEGFVPAEILGQEAHNSQRSSPEARGGQVLAEEVHTLAPGVRPPRKTMEEQKAEYARQRQQRLQRQRELRELEEREEQEALQRAEIMMARRQEDENSSESSDGSSTSFSSEESDVELREDSVDVEFVEIQSKQ